MSKSRFVDVGVIRQFFDRACGAVPAQAPKEKDMKRTISLWIGLLAIGLVPVLAQAPAPANVAATGKIHGHVTNPTGAPQANGTISLNKGTKEIASFPVDANGEYSGSAAPGIYTLVYRTPGLAADKETDKIENVKIVV